MKLLFNENNKDAEVEIPLRVPSRKVKNAIKDYLEEISEIDNSIFESLRRIYSEDELANNDLDKLIQKGFVNGKINPSMIDETRKDELYVLVLKEILDVKGLTTERKTIFAQDIESDFWLSQSLEEVYDTVHQFRRKLTPRGAAL